MRRGKWWPRSLRARLVAIYTLIAVVLGAAGILAFSILLQRGVLASVDASLQARAAPIVNSLGEAGPVPIQPAPTTAPGTLGAQRGAQDGPGAQEAAGVDSFTAIYRPDGQLAQIQPADAAPGPLNHAAVTATAKSSQRSFTVAGGDQQLRVLTISVPRSDGTWVVAAGTDLGDVSDATNKAISALEIAIPLLIVLAALGAWLLSGAALRPVERMRADAANLAERDPAGRITVPATADELASLARTFNALLDRLTRSLARQRDLVADAGHELRTPLAVLRTELELADLPGRSREDLADSVVHARAELERLSKVADDLLFLARADGAAPLIDPVDTDLVALAADSVRAHRARADALGVGLVLDVPDEVAATADPAALRRAVDNLIANALAATGPGGAVTLSIVAGDEITVSIRDDGPGFPPEFIADAFGRFTRPDPSRSASRGGAGLGLAIVAEIVAAHAGSTSAINNPDRGATVSFTIPGRPATTSPSHLAPMSSPPS